MQYAVELYYDEETQNKISALAEMIAQKKISTKFLEWKTRPHLTLACFHDVDECLCIEKLKLFAQNHKTLPISIDSVGMFNDSKTIFLSPTMTRDMYQFQRELHNSLNGFDTQGWEYYCPDQWVPHCTVALTREDKEEAFFQASELILHEFRKMSGEFVEIGLVKVTFPVQEIYTVKLCKK